MIARPRGEISFGPQLLRSCRLSVAIQFFHSGCLLLQMASRCVAGCSLVRGRMAVFTDVRSVKRCGRLRHRGARNGDITEAWGFARSFAARAHESIGSDDEGRKRHRPASERHDCLSR
jgi:hypothetical protein